MNTKNRNLIEKTGFALIVVGFISMLLNDIWTNNPIPNILDKNMYFSSIGLILWSLAYQNRTNQQKEKNVNT